jgi:hypothetical protein
MRKALICILMVLFTGLMAFGSQSINGPGIQDVSNETTISPALINSVVKDALTAVGFPAVIPAWEKCSVESAAIYNSPYVMGIPVSGQGAFILFIKVNRTFECTVQANPIDGKGGVPFFGSTRSAA